MEGNIIINKETIDDICLNWKIARDQRKTEIYNGFGLKGTQGYEEKGCYVCNGYKTNCSSYISNNILNGINKTSKGD